MADNKFWRPSMKAQLVHETALFAITLHNTCQQAQMQYTAWATSHAAVFEAIGKQILLIRNQAMQSLNWSIQDLETNISDEMAVKLDSDLTCLDRLHEQLQSALSKLGPESGLSPEQSSSRLSESSGSAETWIQKILDELERPKGLMARWPGAIEQIDESLPFRSAPFSLVKDMFELCDNAIMLVLEIWPEREDWRDIRGRLLFWKIGTLVDAPYPLDALFIHSHPKYHHMRDDMLNSFIFIVFSAAWQVSKYIQDGPGQEHQALPLPAFLETVGRFKHEKLRLFGTIDMLKEATYIWWIHYIAPQDVREDEVANNVAESYDYVKVAAKMAESLFTWTFALLMMERAFRRNFPAADDHSALVPANDGPSTPMQISRGIRQSSQQQSDQHSEQNEQAAQQRDSQQGKDLPERFVVDTAGTPELDRSQKQTGRQPNTFQVALDALVRSVKCLDCLTG